LPIQARPAQSTGWLPIDRSYADLNATDFSGKTWTVSDLGGKRTLVNVWANWCVPCIAELPRVQELYDKIRTRADVQLITLNVDENPGLAELVVKKQHYTFPVVMWEAYFEQILPPLGISSDVDCG
jgi:thiol-disulfide isomerase/thioredoxin